MSELSEHASEIVDSLPVPESIPKELIRTSDGAKIKIVSESIEINRAPHGIGESYVTEGVILPANVTKDHFMKNGRMNIVGVGKQITESNIELTPFVVYAKQSNGTAWLDVMPHIAPADTMVLDGKTVTFAKFGEFEGAMDLQTVAGILTKQHIEKFAASEIFDDIRGELNRTLELDDPATTVLALWIIMSYVHDAFEAFPYLWFNGVKGSGKTTALELIREMAYHAEMGMRISNPALFRDVDQHRCTICYDEAENLLVGGKGDHAVDQDRVSLFNSGYRASGVVRLVEKDGDNFLTRKFRSYSPKALASIQPIDEALQSRCLMVNMMVALDSAKSGEVMDLLKCAEIRSKLYFLRFAEGVGFHDRARDQKHNTELRKKYDLKNRDWELFKPLLVGAEKVCPRRLHEVANFIDSQKVIRRIDNQFSTDATVLLKVLEMLREAENASEDARAMVTYKELMASLKDDFPELKWMSTRSIGNCLRRLGLASLTARYGKGYVVKFNRELIETQVQRLGLQDNASALKPANIESFSGDAT